MNTSALVAAARTGDRRAFATLAERYYPMARATCARFLGDDGDLALDVTQEAVVTAMLSLDRLRHDDRFGAWLTGITLNLCRRLVSSGDWGVFSLDALLGDGLIASRRRLAWHRKTPPSPPVSRAAVAAGIARRRRRAAQRRGQPGPAITGAPVLVAAALLDLPAGPDQVCTL
ncbi:MAG: RNA polymerase sigma factor [Trebonia sp.]